MHARMRRAGLQAGTTTMYVETWGTTDPPPYRSRHPDTRSTLARWAATHARARTTRHGTVQHSAARMHTHLLLLLLGPAIYMLFIWSRHYLRNICWPGDDVRAPHNRNQSSSTRSARDLWIKSTVRELECAPGATPGHTWTWCVIHGHMGMLRS